MHRPDQHANTFAPRLDPLDQVDAVAGLEGDVDDGHVRLGWQRRAEGLRLISAASPHTFHSGSREMRMASASRTAGWSSTIRILIAGCFCSFAAWEFFLLRMQVTTAPWGCTGWIVNWAPITLARFFMIAQAQTLRFTGLIGKADPVVLDLQNNAVVRGVESNFDVLGLAVLQGVGTRLLGDVVKLRSLHAAFDGNGLLAGEGAPETGIPAECEPVSSVSAAASPWASISTGSPDPERWPGPFESLF